MHAHIKRLETLIRALLRRKIITTILLLGGYAVVFLLLLYPFSANIVLYLFPALLLSWLYGLWWGLAVGTLFGPLHWFLFWLRGEPFLNAAAPNNLEFFFILYFMIVLTTGLIGFLRTIRKQHTTELANRHNITAALRQSEERYRQLVNHSSNILMQMNEKGMISFISQAGMELIGYLPGELVSKHYLELVDPDWRVRVGLFYARQIKAKIRHTFYQFPMRAKSGKRIWVSQGLELLFESGEVVGGQGVITDITALYKAQEALKYNESRFRALTEHVADTTIIISKDRIVDYINISTTNSSQLTAQEIQGQDIIQFIHPADQKEFLRLFQKSIDDGPGSYVKAGPLQVLHKKGYWLYFEGFMTNMLHIDSVQGIVVNIREINKRVEMEKALWESEYNFRTLFNQGNDAVLIFSTDGQVLEANDRTTEMLGYNTVEMVGNCFSNYVDDSQKSIFSENIDQVTAGKHLPVREWLIAHKNGYSLPVEVNLGLVRDSQNTPTKIIAILRDISERKQTERKLRFLATHDALTHLPNRALFYERLKESCRRAKESNYLLGVVFIDLNKFKEINDQHGHDLGDKVLVKVAERLRGCVRKFDTVARMSGDEFTMLLEGIESTSNIESILHKVAEQMDAPFVVQEHQFVVGASIGVSVYPQDSPNPDDILQFADTAMYAAKMKGKTGFVFFNQIDRS